MKLCNSDKYLYLPIIATFHVMFLLLLSLLLSLLLLLLLLLLLYPSIVLLLREGRIVTGEFFKLQSGEISKRSRICLKKLFPRKLIA